MAEIAPFSALRYAPDRAPDLSAVLAPPYDVIGDGERRALEARDPHNVVRLELPRGEGDARYSGAASILARKDVRDLVREDVRTRQTQVVKVRVAHPNPQRPGRGDREARRT